jgi:hypothetical protein
MLDLKNSPMSKARYFGRPSPFFILLGIHNLCIRVSNNIVRNTESASVSIPPQLREEDGAFYWKTDLEETSKYWKGSTLLYLRVKTVLGLFGRFALICL